MGQRCLSGAQWRGKRQWAQIQMEGSHFKQKKTFMTERWNGLSRAVVEAPSLETGKADWMFLSNLL